MTSMTVTGLGSSFFMLVILALWAGMITAVVIVVIALRRWSFAATRQAEAFHRIAAAMEGGSKPGPTHRQVGRSGIALGPQRGTRSDAG